MKNEKLSKLEIVTILIITMKLMVISLKLMI